MTAIRSTIKIDSRDTRLPARRTDVDPSAKFRRRDFLAKTAGTVAAGALLLGTLNSRKADEANDAPSFNPDKSAQISDYETYMVQQGDTATDIARHEKMQNGYSDQTSSLIDEILDQSNKDGNPGLQAGEQLLLPKDKQTPPEA